MVKTRPFDPARYLDDDEALAAYLTDALETGDTAYIAYSLGVIARAKGMTEVARQAGLSRESLYRALSEDGNPGLDTLLRVTRALGIELSASPSKKAA